MDMKHFPIESFKVHPTDKPWITPEIKEAVKKRQKNWSLNKQSSCFKFYRDLVNNYFVNQLNGNFLTRS